MQIPLKCINPRIALLFLRTPVALGGKKAPIPLSIRTTNMLDSKSQSGVFDHMASSKKVSPNESDNRI